MKATIVIPPLEDFYFTRHRFACLGAKTVLHLLLQAGWDASWLNFPLHKKKPASLKLPGEFAYLRPFLVPGETGPLSYFTGFKHFGPSFTACAADIAREKPDAVFLATFAYSYAAGTLQLAAAIKKILPDTAIVAGGAGVTAHPDYFFRDVNIDFVICGEAEISLPPLLKALEKKGSYERQIFRSSPQRAGELPFIWQSTQERTDAVYVSTALSRGCPKNCRFCVNAGDNTFRTVDIKSVQQGLPALQEFVRDRGKTLHLNFEDDNLLYSADYFFKVLELIRKALPGTKFSMENGIDYTLLDSSQATRLIDMGLKQFNLSLGSLDPGLLRQESRSVTLAGYQEVLAAAARQQVPCITYFICGFRNETRESLAGSLVFLADLPTRLGISLFYAVPGLPDFKDMSRFDRLSPRLCLGAGAYPWNGSVSTAELITAFRLSRFINLMKTPEKTEREQQLIELIFHSQELYTFQKLHKQLRPVPVPLQDKALVGKVLNQLA